MNGVGFGFTLYPFWYCFAFFLSASTVHGAGVGELTDPDGGG